MGVCIKWSCGGGIKIQKKTGSVIEVKESCVAWHYRDCDVGHGAWQAKQCIVSLVELAKRTRAIEVNDEDVV